MSSSTTVPTTPRARTTTATTTPTVTRVQSTVLQSSPHYATTRRHSLYGAEDRVVIDPGSRIWKVGFSGEGRPRTVFQTEGNEALWTLGRMGDPNERAEEDRLLHIRLERCLRSLFHDSLLTDPKARKVILVEHPLLPIYVKEMIAKILFDNLQVPSVSFASSHLLSLLSVGRITGLVVDCGHLESVALPIFASRPLYPQLRTTPLAGFRLTAHLRALLLLFGTYLPPPTSLSAAVNIPAANRSTRVPPEVLTDTVIDDIKTRCCFVGDSLTAEQEGMNSSAPATDEFNEFDIPASSDRSESEFSYGFDNSNAPSQRESMSDFSVVSSAVAGAPGTGKNENPLQTLAAMYKRNSTATDLTIRVVPPLQQQNGTGNGTLIIPGWIRERCAEVLFEGGDVDESSIAEVVLDALLKVPVDLRKTMAASILVTGGTAMLPGFISRLHTELLRAIGTPPSFSMPVIPGKVRVPPYDRYAALRPLIPFFAVLNNPSPNQPDSSDRARANAGKAPAFSPAIMAWVGGSLAGALKTGGVEVPREKWDEGDANMEPGAEGDMSMDELRASTSSASDRLVHVLPDWTRIPFRVQVR
ncbi:actin-domain-containing protein [Mycena floridula]|nr:actin-domain-containing protein [Mycena floridula]